MAKILVVEDDVTILNSYAFVLTKKGHEVATAESGKVALELCKNTVFDVIVLDLLMPEMSGLEFLKLANLDAKVPKTKVLVLSNTESAKVREEATKMGIAEYVLKVEITPYDLADKIAALL